MPSYNTDLSSSGYSSSYYDRTTSTFPSQFDSYTYSAPASYNYSSSYYDAATPASYYTPSYYNPSSTYNSYDSYRNTSSGYSYYTGGQYYDSDSYNYYDYSGYQNESSYSYPDYSSSYNKPWSRGELQYQGFVIILDYISHNLTEVQAKEQFTQFVDGSMMFGLFFGIISFLCIQTCYIQSVKKVRNSQVILEDKFMGPPVVMPRALAQPSYVRTGHIAHGANQVV